MKQTLTFTVLTLVLFASSLAAHATTRSYNCNSANNQWSVAANWVPSGVPQNGDTLVFGNLAGNRTTVNDLVNLRLDAIQFTAGSYTVTGNAITLSNGLVAASASGLVFNPALILGKSQTFFLDATSTTQLGSDVNLNGFSLLIDNAAALQASGGFSGTGNVSKQGAGEILLTGSPNTFHGTLTHLSGGQLRVAKASCFPTNFLGYGITEFLTSNATHTNGEVALYPGAKFLGGSLTNTLRNLTLQGATIEGAAMTFVLRSNLTTLGWGTPSVIIAKFDLLNTDHAFNIADGGASTDLEIAFGDFRGGAGAGFTKTGAGKLYLRDVTATHGGTNRIAAGILEVGMLGNALGNGRTVVEEGASLQVLNGASLGSYFELHGHGVGGTNGALRSLGFCSLSGTCLIPTAATIRADGEMHLNGNIGGAGHLRISGTNELWTHGAANTLAGGYWVHSGTFVLGKANGTVAVASPILVGTNSLFAAPLAGLRNFESNQITAAVTIGRSGTYDLDGKAEALPTLDLIGGATVLLNGGRLTLNGDLSVFPNFFGNTATIKNGGYLDFGTGTRNLIVNDSSGIGADALELDVQTTILTGSANIVKKGNGDARFQAENSHSGTFTIEAGDVEFTSLFAFGSSAATAVTGPGALVLSGAAFSDTEPFIFNGTGRVDSATLVIKDDTSLRGAITLQQPTRVFVNTNAQFTLRSPIGGAGGLIKEGPGELLFDWDRTNTFTGGLLIQDGQVTLDRDRTNLTVVSNIVIGDGVGAAGSAKLVVQDLQQIGNSVDATLASDGRLILTNLVEHEVIRRLQGAGQLSVYGYGLRMNDSGLDAVFSGAINGNGDLIKAGAGKFTHHGNCGANGMTFTLLGGETAINGVWFGAPTATTIDAYSGTVLSGTGIVQNVNLRSGAVLSPGSSPGRFTLNHLTMASGANLFMELRGPSPGLQHDQLVAKSSVNISNASLTLALNYPPAQGDVIRLVDNQSANPILGIFSGKPQGSIITESGNQFVISYTGGTGNDITLTATNAKLALAAVFLPGGNGLVDAGECNELYLVLTNQSGGSLSGVTASLDSRSPAIAVSQQNSPFPNFAANSARTNATPFRLSTLPGFQCGQLVELQLTVTAGGSTFAIPVTLKTGTLGTPSAFNATSAVAIPDLATTNSTINVATFSAPVAKVTVSLHLNHTFAADLEIFLQSPSGRLVKLVADRGGSGDNFGTNCSPGTARTTFDDSSRNPIALAAAPFVGAFSPEEPLTTFQGEWGNGAWKLIITDDASGDTGTLNCWTLTLYSAVCAADAASACQPCAPLFAGNLSGQSPTMPQRIYRDANPGVCGETKLCPGTSAAVGPFRYATHTFTNTGPGGCVTVVLQDQCANQSLFATAYLGGSFNPANLCANYLGDIGTNGLAPVMSFYAASNAVFTVVVSELIPQGSCPAYTLQLFGLACPAPVLHIAPVPAGLVRLSWNASGSEGYVLQTNGSLTTPNWFDSGAPVVVGNDYVVTNAASGPARFYRLFKP